MEIRTENTQCNFRIVPYLIFDGMKTSGLIATITGLAFANHLVPSALVEAPIFCPFGSNHTFGNGALTGAYYALGAYSIKYLHVMFFTDRPSKCVVLNNILIGYTVTFVAAALAKQYFGQ